MAAKAKNRCRAGDVYVSEVPVGAMTLFKVGIWDAPDTTYLTLRELQDLRKIITDLIIKAKTKE